LKLKFKKISREAAKARRDFGFRLTANGKRLTAYGISRRWSVGGEFGLTANGKRLTADNVAGNNQGGLLREEEVYWIHVKPDRAGRRGMGRVVPPYPGPALGPDPKALAAVPENGRKP